MGAGPPSVWSTTRRNDHEANLVTPYAGASTIDSLFLGMEEGVIPPRPETEQQQCPGLGYAIYQGFCKGFIIVMCIVSTTFIILMTSTSSSRGPGQINPYQSAALLTFVISMTLFLYKVIDLDIEEVAN
ncbi:hypothetical protein EJB05_18097 [Eragrostis curvula]|uniref:Uncharacterized protein n=1 Tax=Eragrostis curvula TaxID=38414 RepID=A0A5J9VKT0_9POAL|nr:hypothetical protein EJB05_18097 [Eragrostis curvula]